MAEVCTGFEFGTTAGAATGNAGLRLFDSLTGTVTFDTGTPRTGARCLQIALTASNAIGWTTSTLGSSMTKLVASGWFRLSVDPTAGTQWAYFGTAAAAESISMEYHFGSDIIRLWSAATSTGVDSNIAIVANTWYHLDFSFDVSANPWEIRWRIDGIDQPTLSPARAASTVASWRFGSLGFANGGTARYDDWIMSASTTGDEYPYGPMKIPTLTVDPAGTFTLVGGGAAASDFNTFTANGTLAAWNATTARNNTDEIPPTIGASADGWVQVTADTDAGVSMPMTTYTLLHGEKVVALRQIAPGWAVSTTGATFGFRSFNGTTETILQAGTVDPNFDNSTTVPAWACHMLNLAEFSTQEQLDAMEMRAGWSSDATPDIGIHAIYVEVAVRENTTPTLVMARWNK